LHQKLQEKAFITNILITEQAKGGEPKTEN